MIFIIGICLLYPTLAHPTHIPPSSTCLFPHPTLPHIVPLDAYAVTVLLFCSNGTTPHTTRLPVAACNALPFTAPHYLPARFLTTHTTALHGSLPVTALPFTHTRVPFTLYPHTHLPPTVQHHPHHAATFTTTHPTRTAYVLPTLPHTRAAHTLPAFTFAAATFAFRTFCHLLLPPRHTYNTRLRHVLALRAFTARVCCAARTAHTLLRAPHALPPPHTHTTHPHRTDTPPHIVPSRWFWLVTGVVRVCGLVGYTPPQPRLARLHTPLRLPVPHFAYPLRCPYTHLVCVTTVYTPATFTHAFAVYAHYTRLHFPRSCTLLPLQPAAAPTLHGLAAHTLPSPLPRRVACARRIAAAFTATHYTRTRPDAHATAHAARAAVLPFSPGFRYRCRLPLLPLLHAPLPPLLARATYHHRLPTWRCHTACAHFRRLVRRRYARCRCRTVGAYLTYGVCRLRGVLTRYTRLTPLLDVTRILVRLPFRTTHTRYLPFWFAAYFAHHYTTLRTFAGWFFVTHVTLPAFGQLCRLWFTATTPFPPARYAAHCVTTLVTYVCAVTVPVDPVSPIPPRSHDATLP